MNLRMRMRLRLRYGASGDRRRDRRRINVRSISSCSHSCWENTFNNNSNNEQTVWIANRQFANWITRAWTDLCWHRIVAHLLTHRRLTKQTNKMLIMCKNYKLLFLNCISKCISATFICTTATKLLSKWESIRFET